MTKTFLFLAEPISLLGLTWPAGLLELNDIGWARKLQAAGAQTLQADEYHKRKAVAAANDAPESGAAAPAMGADGENDSGNAGRDQVSAADAIRTIQSRRPYRRVS